MAGFNTAVTGLKAAQTDLDVTGNNIANSSTIGFKGSRTEFGDIYATAVVGAGAANVAGSGVTVTDIAQDFKAGTIEFTNNNLDLAINGSGFFQLDDGQGGTTYTRAGSFELDKDGFIVSKTGKYLQGFGLDDQGNQLPIGDLAVTQKESPPKATEDIDLSFNIDSRDDASTLTQPYSKDDPNSLTYSTTVRTFDSLGNEHTIKYDFVEQPAHREVQTISFLGSDFAATADADSDGRADANISISSAEVNLTVLQKSIGVQPEFGNIGQVKGLTLTNGMTGGTATESINLTFGTETITLTGLDNSTGAFSSSTSLASLLAGNQESAIVSAYNGTAGVLAGTSPKLLGVAVDPQDASTLIFQFDNTATAPASVTIDNTVGPSTPNAEGVVGWELGDTIDVGAEISALLTTDPRIAQVKVVDGSPNNLVIRFNADATDVEDLQVRSASDNSLRTDITITSTTLAANEVHTYTFNVDDTSVFDANGLVQDYAIKIGGISIPLNQFASVTDIQDTIDSYQQVILDANPDLEQVSFNNSGQLEITFKAELGDVNDDTALEIDLGSPSLMSRNEIVEGDSGYQGVYRMYAYLNGTELLDIGKDVDPGSPNFLSFEDESNPSEPGPILIKFNSTNGLLSEINGQTVVPNAAAPVINITGADPANPTTTIALDLTGTTQFASASIVKASAQDGYTKGDLVGVTFSETGEMVASFSNGQQQALGIVAVASFENQSGLTPAGDTEWVATLASGDATVNPPGTGLNGTLRSAALEQSNVDLSEELVRLIEAQRNFQANSKTLETLNTVTQSILQI